MYNEQEGEFSDFSVRGIDGKVHEFMCQLLLVGEDPLFSSAHFLLILEWNLMPCAEIVVNYHAGNISWMND